MNPTQKYAGRFVVVDVVSFSTFSADLSSEGTAIRGDVDARTESFKTSKVLFPFIPTQYLRKLRVPFKIKTCQDHIVVLLLFVCELLPLPWRSSCHVTFRSFCRQCSRWAAEDPLQKEWLSGGLDAKVIDAANHSIMKYHY